MILEPPKIKSATVSPSVSHEVMGPDAMIFVFWMLSFKPTFGQPSIFSIHIFQLLFSFSPFWMVKLTDGSSVCLQCRRPGFNPWVRKIPWRREGQPAPIFLPGKSHGQRRLVGYSPWGHKKLGHDWATFTLWMKQTGPVHRQTCACFICCICLTIRGQWSTPLPEFYICTLCFYWMGSL